MSRPTNPDQLLLHAFRDSTGPRPIDSNPLALLLGASLIQVNRDSRAVRVRFTPTLSLKQGADLIQGGIVCAMLDFVMAFAVLACLKEGEDASTVNMAVSYLRPAPVEDLMGTGFIDQLGNKLAFTRAELSTTKDTVVATASSTLAVLR